MASTTAPIATQHAIAAAKSILLDVFNERDPEKRLSAMHRWYSPNISFYDSENFVHGDFEKISEIAGNLLQMNPSDDFVPEKRMHVVANMAMLDWTWGHVKGGDIFVFDQDGKVEQHWVRVNGLSDVSLEV